MPIKNHLANDTSVPSAVTSYTFTSFLNDYPLVLSREILSQEVPYLGGDAEINFYVEGLRFTDKDFNGLISINLSVLEPISEVSASNISFNSSQTWLYDVVYLLFVNN